MITRPLDVSTRLRPPPRSYDYLFWVNGALIALFFTFFGSRFVISPGVGVATAEDMLPVVRGSVVGGVPTQLTLSIEGDQMYVESGSVTLPMLKVWLAEQAEQQPGATLLIHYNVKNSTAELLLQVVTAANAVGIRTQLSALEATDSGAVSDSGR
jgi:hypothetical protein